ncbi:hypothetical protein ABIB62_000786 [Mucilaginibacter sp. UYP25]
MQTSIPEHGFIGINQYLRAPASDAPNNLMPVQVYFSSTIKKY